MLASAFHHRRGVAGLASGRGMRCFEEDSDYQTEKSAENHSSNGSVLVHKAPFSRRREAIIQC